MSAIGLSSIVMLPFTAKWSVAGVVMVLVILGIVSGCQFKGGRPGPEVDLPENAWHPQPVAMRIYPATRFVMDQGHFILEARVELFDQMGDSIKGVGSFAFELLEGAGPLGQGVGKRLYAWDVHLLRLDDQQNHYDPITRGYLFRLRLDDSAVAGHTTILRVMFMPARGKRLLAQEAVRQYRP